MRSASALALALCAGLALSTVAAAAGPPKKLRAAEGFDMTGTWDRDPPGGAARTDKTVPPPPLKPEYLGKWQAEQKAFDDAVARGEPPATGYVHCLPDGMPAMMMGMFPMEILQTPGQVTIHQEAYNQVRRIWLGQTQLPAEDAEPGFWGHSVGRWEGDTLVVDTVGIKQNVRFRDVPHSQTMRITERIRVLSDERIEDKVTVTDPEFLTGPWTWTWGFKRRPDYKMNEYVCEDNREFADPETGAQRLRLLPGTKAQ